MRHLRPHRRRRPGLPAARRLPHRLPRPLRPQHRPVHRWASRAGALFVSLFILQCTACPGMPSACVAFQLRCPQALALPWLACACRADSDPLPARSAVPLRLPACLSVQPCDPTPPASRPGSTACTARCTARRRRTGMSGCWRSGWRRWRQRSRCGWRPATRLAGRWMGDGWRVLDGAAAMRSCQADMATPAAPPSRLSPACPLPACLVPVHPSLACRLPARPACCCGCLLPAPQKEGKAKAAERMSAAKQALAAQEGERYTMYTLRANLETCRCAAGGGVGTWLGGRALVGARAGSCLHAGLPTPGAIGRAGRRRTAPACVGWLRPPPDTLHSHLTTTTTATLPAAC